MKKWFTVLLAVALMLTMAVPAFAAVTGEWTDPTLEITKKEEAEAAKMEKKGEIFDFSEFGKTDAGTVGHRMAYEFNADLQDTILVKQDNDRNPNNTEYIVYKMAKNIAGFEFLTQCCAGLGDPLKDLSIFISKNGKDGWVQVKTQATYYEYDPNIYIHWEKAYWFKSTLTNAQKIPTGYKYLKVQFNPCNDQGDCTWNVAIDSLKIIMGSNVDPVTIPENQKFKDWDTINAEREATRTTKGDVTTQANVTTTTTKKADTPATTTKKADTTTTKKGETTTQGGNKTTTQGGNKTTTQGGNNTPTQGGNNTPTQGGNNAPTQGGKVTTTATNAQGQVITDPTTTATNAQGQVITDPTTTATDANGEVITDPTTTATDANGEIITDPTTTATAEDGTVITDPTNAVDGDNAINDDASDADTDAEGNQKKGPGALPWIIGGIVLLGGAAAAVYFLVIKKKQA